MNIYCIIFMCSFGANSTDTEMPSNALAENKGNGTDVASMILPEKGEPVPQFGDIVMELPDVIASTEPKMAKFESNDRTQTGQDKRTPSLTEILLPPVPLRVQRESQQKV